MSGQLIDSGAPIVCAHGGRASAVAPNTRVRLGGVASLTLATPMLVTGCGVPPATGSRCASAVWLTGTTRVTASGVPLVVAGSASVCAPTATPLTIIASAARVVALGG